MSLNFPIMLLAALIPMIVGMIWYNPKVFGNVWMDASGMTDEKIKTGNMPLIYGISFVFAVFLAVEMNFVVIHQWHLESIFFHELEAKNQEIIDLVAKVNELGGTNHRTFGHGFFHGTIVGVLFALPILATNAMFERKSVKYILVNAGYWILTIALMGGVICQFA